VDARILSKRPSQFAIANVNGDYLGRSGLKEAVGKAAGRGAGVETASTADIEMEKRERIFKLDATPRYVTSPLRDFNLGIN
jgi:hypothetical protein